MTFRRLSMKWVHLLLIGSLAVEHAAWAAPAFEPAEVRVAERASATLGFPEAVASVEDAWSAGPAARTIYLFQDAHDNFSGQANLSRALDHLLEKKSGLRWIFVEGGAGDNSLSFLRPYAPAEKRRRIADLYLRKGVLHGEEHLDIAGDRDIRLWGVEDLSLYAKALDVYKKTAGERERFLAYLNEVDAAAESLKPVLLNPRLAALDQVIRGYHQNKVSMTAYVETLESAASEAGMDQSRFPELSRFADLRAREAVLNFEKASLEQARALSAISEADRRELTELAESASRSPFKVAGEDREGRMAFYAALGQKLGASVSGYPALSLYLDYLKEARRIQTEAILDELQALEDAVVAAYTWNAAEETLLRTCGVSALYRKLFELRLTPREYSRFREITGSFGIEKAAGFLNRKIVATGTGRDRALLLEKGFGQAVENARNFYDLTLSRDEQMVRRALQKMAAENTAQAVLITGGFHTTNLKHLLKAQKISYVSVRPQVLHETNLRRYEAALFNQPALLPMSAVVSTLRRGETLTTNPASLVPVAEALGAPADILNGARLVAAPTPRPGVAVPVTSTVVEQTLRRELAAFQEQRRLDYTAGYTYSIQLEVAPDGSIGRVYDDRQILPPGSFSVIIPAIWGPSDGSLGIVAILRSEVNETGRMIPDEIFGVVKKGILSFNRKNLGIVRLERMAAGARQSAAAADPAELQRGVKSIVMTYAGSKAPSEIQDTDRLDAIGYESDAHRVLLRLALEDELGLPADQGDEHARRWRTFGDVWASVRADLRGLRLAPAGARLAASAAPASFGSRLASVPAARLLQPVSTAQLDPLLVASAAPDGLGARLAASPSRASRKLRDFSPDDFKGQTGAFHNMLRTLRQKDTATYNRALRLLWAGQMDGGAELIMDDRSPISAAAVKGIHQGIDSELLSRPNLYLQRLAAIFRANASDEYYGNAVKALRDIMTPFMSGVVNHKRRAVAETPRRSAEQMLQSVRVGSGTLLDLFQALRGREVILSETIARQTRHSQPLGVYLNLLNQASGQDPVAPTHLRMRIGAYRGAYDFDAADFYLLNSVLENRSPDLATDLLGELAVAATFLKSAEPETLTQRLQDLRFTVVTEDQALRTVVSENLESLKDLIALLSRRHANLHGQQVPFDRVYSIRQEGEGYVLSVDGTDIVAVNDIQAARARYDERLREDASLGLPALSGAERVAFRRLSDQFPAILTSIDPHAVRGIDLRNISEESLELSQGTFDPAVFTALLSQHFQSALMTVGKIYIEGESDLAPAASEAYQAAMGDWASHLAPRRVTEIQKGQAVTFVLTQRADRIKENQQRLRERLGGNAFAVVASMSSTEMSFLAGAYTEAGLISTVTRGHLEGGLDTENKDLLRAVNQSGLLDVFTHLMESRLHTQPVQAADIIQALTLSHRNQEWFLLKPVAVVENLARILGARLAIGTSA